MPSTDLSPIVIVAPHPGEHLREDFMPPYGLTAGKLAKAMGLKNRSRIERLVREQQAITADTALRLARVFGNSPQFWMNLQSTYDLSKTRIPPWPTCPTP